MQQGSRQGAPPGLPFGQADRLNRGDNGGNNLTSGSARDAREAMEAEQRSRGRDADSRARTPSGAQSSAPRNKRPVPSAIANGRGNPGAIGAAISRPAPMPQWPLAESRMDPIGEGGVGRGDAPQRPPRPRYVPSVLDSSKIQDHTPSSFAYKTVQSTQQPQLRNSVEGSIESVGVSSPLSAYDSNRESQTSTSSMGTIPDFPQTPTATAGPPRRSSNYGPPPSRRGNSSFYSQSSYVSPIPEETAGLRTPGSYASSHVIPASWGPGSEDFQPAKEGMDPLSDEEDGRLSRSTGDDDEDGLVRKASLGKRHKPSLTTIKNSEKLVPLPSRPPVDSEQPTSISSGKDKAMPTGTVGKGNIPASVVGAAGSGMSQSYDGEADQLDTPSPAPPTRTTFLSVSEPSPGSREESPPSREITQSVSPVDPRVNKVLGTYENDSRDNSYRTKPARSSFSDRLPGLRRPPKLNIDAVREAESRGSLTSLPDLIKRATRLAAVLEKGRPESGWEDYSGDSREGSNASQRRSGSISDILASFPPPVLAAPRDNRRQSRGLSRWPLPADGFTPVDRRSADVDPRPTRRRCCGLPRWALILLAAIALLVVVAAIAVPLKLVSLSKQKNKSGGTSAQEDLRICQQQFQCMNGGSMTANGKFCQCTCINGFSGDRCAVPSSVGCVTINAGSEPASQNATVGSAISRLLEDANKNFSIPLNSTTILSLFTTNGLSCTSQNALVTFDGRPSPVVQGSAQPSIAQSTTITNAPTKRSIPTTSSILTVPDLSYIYYESASQTEDPAPAPTASGQGSSNSLVVDEIMLDFARVSVLFILQEEHSLAAAVTAQTRLQNAFNVRGGSPRVDVGGNTTVGFNDMTVNLGDGREVGCGKPRCQ
ncbi:MAG: hypothetical protein M1840_004078 [Geoglossum simile]|nr:MAG: hypothetical protein M1840_004078 [Geoglossum simile]